MEKVQQSIIPQVENTQKGRTRRELFLGRRQSPSDITDTSQNKGSVEGNFLTRALNKVLPRREFLKKGALAGIIAYSSLIESDHLSWVKLVEHFYASKSWEELEAERKVVYSKTQLFTEDDRQFLGKEVPQHKAAYVITHPGYSENWFLKELIRVDETHSIYGEKFANEMVELVREVRNGSFYGDYNKYLGSIMELISKLNQSGELVIFALEEVDFYNTAIPRPNLLPGKNSRIVVTDTEMGIFTENELQTKEGPVYQKPEIMFDLLRQAGVEEVRVAGEWSFDEGDLACLGGVAESFREAGFKVRGIQGAIFPNLTLEDVKPEPKDKELLNSLYGSESISFPEVLKGVSK